MEIKQKPEETATNNKPIPANAKTKYTTAKSTMHREHKDAVIRNKPEKLTTHPGALTL